MKSRKTLSLSIVLLIGLAATLYGAATHPAVTQERYEVVRIIDGDTIEIRQDNKTQSVRLLGVDAPERGQCYFEESSLFLSELLKERTVTLQEDPLNDNNDEYGRLLRYVYINDNLVNETLIKIGMTRYLDFFPIIFDTQFAVLEHNAKENELGLWSEC